MTHVLLVHNRPSYKINVALIAKIIALCVVRPPSVTSVMWVSFTRIKHVPKRYVKLDTFSKEMIANNVRKTATTA